MSHNYDSLAHAAMQTSSENKSMNLSTLIFIEEIKKRIQKIVSKT